MNQFNNIKTPCFVIDMAKLTANLEVLQGLQQRTGCKVLLAQKAFSMYSLYPLMSQYLSGTAASGLYEAQLAHECFSGEVHVFSPAFTDSDFDELTKICSHIVFNSMSQWDKYKSKLPKHISPALRVNPEHSTQDPRYAIYDPCAPNSRFGVTAETLRNADPAELAGLQGLHFHTLCQQNSDALAATLDVVERNFGWLFPQLKYINMGGGHHITRDDYDLSLLEDCIRRIQSYGLELYLEPGEAVALNAGYLAATVLDILDKPGMSQVAILDASAACHMPDVLEMPYRPHIVGSGEPGKKPHSYLLGGNTCLAGDIIGEYSFDKPLSVGVQLAFTDMAIYTMVKTNTFNGMPLPDIAVLHEGGKVELVREFGYDEFKRRL